MKAVQWLLRNWAAMGLLGFAIAFYYDRQNRNLMHERAKFTVGTIDGWHQTAKSGRFFGFKFSVAGQPYGGSSGWHSGMNEADGSPCLVEYDSLAPTMNAGHFAVPIPDSLRHVPANGWRVPPFPVPAWITDHGRKD